MKTSMQNDNVKKQLIDATMKLLSNSNNPSKITKEANANLVMINYYFGSKDTLVNMAVNTLLANRSKELKEIIDSRIAAKQKLIPFLTAISDITIDFSELTKPTISYLLLEGDIELPYQIKECCSTKTDLSLKIIKKALIFMPCF
jgi:AcrR family transcriptional regulator